VILLFAVMMACEFELSCEFIPTKKIMMTDDDGGDDD